MEVYTKTMSIEQKKLMKWVTPIILDVFPFAKKAYGTPNSKQIRFEIGASRNEMATLCKDLNKMYPTIYSDIWWHRNEGKDSVSSGIYIQPTDFWEMDFDSNTFNFIRRKACKNEIPFDYRLKNEISKSWIDIEHGRKYTDDGFGIEGEYAGHKINFTVEAVEYDTHYDIDFGDELVPCLWVYSGCWNDHHIEGLATSSAFAVGKMLKAVYKNAERHCPEVSQGLKANFFRFIQYGFCR